MCYVLPGGYSSRDLASVSNSIRLYSVLDYSSHIPCYWCPGGGPSARGPIEGKACFDWPPGVPPLLDLAVDWFWTYQSKPVCSTTPSTNTTAELAWLIHHRFYYAMLQCFLWSNYHANYHIQGQNSMCHSWASLKYQVSSVNTFSMDCM